MFSAADEEHAPQEEAARAIFAQFREGCSWFSWFLGVLGDWSSGGRWGYGYQWWVAPEEEGEPAPVDFMAIGIFGQFIYINREKDVVIVKNSAYQDYYNTGLAAKREAAYVLRDLAESL